MTAARRVCQAFRAKHAEGSGVVDRLTPPQVRFQVSADIDLQKTWKPIFSCRELLYITVIPISCKNDDAPQIRRSCFGSPGCVFDMEQGLKAVGTQGISLLRRHAGATHE